MSEEEGLASFLARYKLSALLSPLNELGVAEAMDLLELGA
jgi:hypothetical protein